MTSPASPFPITSLFLAVLVLQPLSGQDDLPEEEVRFFETHIRPALVNYCYECHSEESGKTRGGLLLDTREGMWNGGTSGALMKGEGDYPPLLLDAIHHADPDYAMPPKEKMPTDVIAKFEEWLAMGAPDPRLREAIVVDTTIDLEAGKDHWAFQPPVSPGPGTTIDSLVLAGQKEAGLSPVGKADAVPLMRRLSFDLTGLPPSPEEAGAFFREYRSDPEGTIARKVDELLAKDQFGERWGRHWLDVVRFAESSGSTSNNTFPHAWRYRNYVIDSFNADKPYPEFVAEQLAGDLLPTRSTAEEQEHLIATGFLAVGIKNLGNRNPRTFLMDTVDDQIDATTQAFLGLTVSCARCHDHKFDPVPTADYYALAGIFTSTEMFYGTAFGQQNHQPRDLIELPIPDSAPASSTRNREETLAALNAAQTKLKETRARARAMGEDDPEAPTQRQFVAMRNKIGELEGILATMDESGKPITFAMGVRDAAAVGDTVVLFRGDVERPAQEVPRGFLQVIDGIETESIANDESGRAQLAQWITSANNPLTARVMVNRIWMNLFGAPLKPSPNNWGLTGAEPNHPELLDYLAVRFVRNGWSVKSLIREIVLSDAYQRDSQYHAGNDAVDPDNIHLWRFNPRQLDAESLRDSILAASGKLDLDRPRASFVAEAGDGRVGRVVDADLFAQPQNVRSIYLPIIRGQIVEPLALFDFPDPVASTESRDQTNVAPQALYLMNSPEILDLAQTMALHLWERHPDEESRIRRAFLQAYGRPPTDDDVAAARDFFASFTPVTVSSASPETTGPRRDGNRKGERRRTAAMTEADTSPTLTAEQQTLALFCQSLMASAEFRILN